MITHLVLFDLKAEHRDDADRLASELVESLRHLPMVHSVRGGADVRGSERSSDVALIVTLEDVEALET